MNTGSLLIHTEPYRLQTVLSILKMHPHHRLTIEKIEDISSRMSSNTDTAFIIRESFKEQNEFLDNLWLNRLDHLSHLNSA